MFREPSNPASSKQEKIDWADHFYELLDTLGDELGRRWQDDLEPKIDSGNLSYQQACAVLDDILLKRDEVLHKRHDPLTKANEEMVGEVNAEERRRLIERLLLSNSDENALGSGRVAEVFRIDGSRGICCKKVKNYKAYRDEEENSTYQESQLLESLLNFEVEGVRAPRFVQCFGGGDFDAILMEEVNGKSLEQLMNGDEDFPEKFDPDVFFKSLEKFLDVLHERKQVFHLDIAPRNVMVDRLTGLPVLIDFGRARRFDFSEEVRLEDSRDRAGFEATRAEVRDFFRGKRAIARIS